MNIRCTFCQTPFGIGRTEKLVALQHMYTENLTHYDAHCPRCRRATPVLREKMEQTFPDWRDALHELEQHVEAAPAAAPQPEAVAATTEPAHAKHHRSRAGAKAKAPAKPVAAPKAKTAGKKKSA